MERIKQYLFRLAGLIRRGFQRVTKGLPIRGFPQRRIRWMAAWIAGGVAVTMLLLMLSPRWGSPGVPKSQDCRDSGDRHWTSLYEAQFFMLTARDEMQGIQFGPSSGSNKQLKDLTPAELLILNQVDLALNEASRLLQNGINEVNSAVVLFCLNRRNEVRIRRALVLARDKVEYLIDLCRSTAIDQTSIQALATIDVFLNFLERAIEHKKDAEQDAITALYLVSCVQGTTSTKCSEEEG